MKRLTLFLAPVENRRDVDIYVRDAFGRVHVLFPQEKKEIAVISEEDKNGTNGRRADTIRKG